MNNNSDVTYNQIVEKSNDFIQYRIKLAAILKPYRLSVMQWAVLGCIYDSQEDGITVSALAARLNTSLAFITTITNLLESRGYISKCGSVKDSRKRVMRVRYEIEMEKAVEKIKQQLSRKIS